MCGYQKIKSVFWKFCQLEIMAYVQNQQIMHQLLWPGDFSQESDGNLNV